MAFLYWRFLYLQFLEIISPVLILVWRIFHIVFLLLFHNFLLSFFHLFFLWSFFFLAFPFFFACLLSFSLACFLFRTFFLPFPSCVLSLALSFFLFYFLSSLSLFSFFLFRTFLLSFIFLSVCSFALYSNAFSSVSFCYDFFFTFSRIIPKFIVTFLREISAFGYSISWAIAYRAKTHLKQCQQQFLNDSFLNVYVVYFDQRTGALHALCWLK